MSNNIDGDCLNCEPSRERVLKNKKEYNIQYSNGKINLLAS